MSVPVDSLNSQRWEPDATITTHTKNSISLIKKALEGLYSDFMSHQVEQLGFFCCWGLGFLGCGFLFFFFCIGFIPVILKHRHLPQSLCLQIQHIFLFQLPLLTSPLNLYVKNITILFSPLLWFLLIYLCQQWTPITFADWHPQSKRQRKK